MRILILGAGKMGSFFTDILSFQHETAVFDVNPHQLRFVYNTYRFTTLEEIKEFEPELWNSLCDLLSFNHLIIESGNRVNRLYCMWFFGWNHVAWNDQYYI